MSAGERKEHVKWIRYFAVSGENCGKHFRVEQRVRVVGPSSNGHT